MSEKRKHTNKTPKKSQIEKPPTLSERITDFSTGAYSNVKVVPKKKKKSGNRQ